MSKMKWVQLQAHDFRMQLLQYIREYKVRTGGWSPTIQEIIDQGFYTSKSMVNYALGVLERDGYIQRVDKRKSGSSMRIRLPDELYHLPEWDGERVARFE